MDGTRSPATLRPPEEVMRLSRMGSAHPTRLSFMRILLRRLEAEQWCFDLPVWEIDADGVGHAVYRVRGPVRAYSLVAFAHNLPDELRSDRVIAEAWDATFVLFDGEPTNADIARLARNVPKQEAGRVSGSELTLSRANKSVRLFDHVVECLAEGRQPSTSELAKVGYLMRTTAVYGSGKFGLCDRECYQDRAELAAPFQAEMLTVWLIRAFTVDLVEHLARAREPGALRLDRELRSKLGVGNSTGLGMAPFLLKHPELIHKWFSCREIALSRVRETALTPESVGFFRAALQCAILNADDWHSDHPVQQDKLVNLRGDLGQIAEFLAGDEFDTLQSWNDVWCWGAEILTAEGQEQLLALMLEPHAGLVDDLAEKMALFEDESAPLYGSWTIADLRADIASAYSWALDTDWEDPSQTARLWYVSAEKLEPRLADRTEEPLDAYEQPLSPGRDVALLDQALGRFSGETTVADFLDTAPEFRSSVRRVQLVARMPYAEVRDNTISTAMMPIDLLRAKLSFFGATRFDPRSDRWVRISMFQGAPYPDEMNDRPLDTWMYGP